MRGGPDHEWWCRVCLKARGQDDQTLIVDAVTARSDSNRPCPQAVLDAAGQTLTSRWRVVTDGRGPTGGQGIAGTTRPEYSREVQQPRHPSRSRQDRFKPCDLRMDPHQASLPRVRIEKVRGSIHLSFTKLSLRELIPTRLSSGFLSSHLR